MPAADLVIPQVHPALLLLAQPVVVLVCRRVEGGRNPVALRADVLPPPRPRSPAPSPRCACAAASCRPPSLPASASLWTGRRLDLRRPRLQSRDRAAEIQRIQRHRLRQFLARKISRRHAHHHPLGSKHIVPPSASRSCVHPSAEGFATNPYPGAPVAAALSVLIVTRKMFGA